MSRFRPEVLHFPNTATISTQRGRKPALSQGVVNATISRRDCGRKSCTLSDIRSLLVEERCRLINNERDTIHPTPSSFRVCRKTVNKRVSEVAPDSMVVMLQTVRRLRGINWEIKGKSSEGARIAAVESLVAAATKREAKTKNNVQMKEKKEGVYRKKPPSKHERQRKC